MKITMLAIGIYTFLAACTTDNRPQWKNPYGPPPVVGFGPAYPAHYGGTPYPGGIGPYGYYGGAVPPYGANLSNWGPYGGLGGWGLQLSSHGTAGGGRGK